MGAEVFVLLCFPSFIFFGLKAANLEQEVRFRLVAKLYIRQSLYASSGVTKMRSAHVIVLVCYD